jgi:deoxyribodipyrimidine photo-lyase
MHPIVILECLFESRDDLVATGQYLIVRVGSAHDVLDQLSKHVQICQVFSHKETGNAWTFESDKTISAWCRKRGIPWTEAWKNGVVRRLKDRNGWARNWSRRMNAPMVDGTLRLEPLPELEPAQSRPQEIWAYQKTDARTGRAADVGPVLKRCRVS